MHEIDSHSKFARRAVVPALCFFKLEGTSFRPFPPVDRSICGCVEPHRYGPVLLAIRVEGQSKQGTIQHPYVTHIA